MAWSLLESLKEAQQRPDHNKMELTKISDRVRLVVGPANVGIVLLENSEVVLIDSGLDEKHATKIYELLADYRFKVSAILNTHAHADHIGGNAFFQQKTGCKIFASTLEAPMVRQPLIQSAVLFSGAPVTELTNRFIMANPSRVDIIPENKLCFADVEIKIIDLPGHSINQKGFEVDGVAFIADSIFPESFFKKQRLPFIYDPATQMETIEKLRKYKAQHFVGGHFQPTRDIGPMLEVNYASIKDSIDFLRNLLRIPQPQDRIVKTFLDNFGIRKNNWEYFLYRATVNGYLSSLYKHGQIKYRVMENLLVWYAL